MIEAYPLCWPIGYSRSIQRKDSRFTTTLGQARDYVKAEIKRIGGKNPIISTNIPLKNDGNLRADWSKYKIDDPGVAVYFEYDGEQVCLCSDAYKRVWENLKGIGRTIEALRQIERDGVSDFLKRSFRGFKELPEERGVQTSVDNIWEILGITPTTDKEKIRKAYRAQAKKHHPDNAGGSQDMMARLNEAFESANYLADKR